MPVSGSTWREYSMPWRRRLQGAGGLQVQTWSPAGAGARSGSTRKQGRRAVVSCFGGSAGDRARSAPGSSRAAGLSAALCGGSCSWAAAAVPMRVRRPTPALQSRSPRPQPRLEGHATTPALQRRQPQARRALTPALPAQSPPPQRLRPLHRHHSAPTVATVSGKVPTLTPSPPAQSPPPRRPGAGPCGSSRPPAPRCRPPGASVGSRALLEKVLQKA